MPHVSMLRDYSLPAGVPDVRGTTLYGREHEPLGIIEDVIFDHDNGEVRYFVLNSGHGRRVLVPRNRVHPSAAEDGELESDVTSRELEHLPAFDQRFIESREQWEGYEELHRTAVQDAARDRDRDKAAVEEEKRTYEEHPVQHMKGSANVITPPGMPAEGGEPAEGEIDASELFPERLADKFTDTTPFGSKLTMVPAGTSVRAADAAYGVSDLGPRWSGFEEFLRRDVVNMRRECPQCRLEDHRAA